MNISTCLIKIKWIELRTRPFLVTPDKVFRSHPFPLSAAFAVWLLLWQLSGQVSIKKRMNWWTAAFHFPNFSLVSSATVHGSPSPQEIFHGNYLQRTQWSESFACMCSNFLSAIGRFSRKFACKPIISPIVRFVRVYACARVHTVRSSWSCWPGRCSLDAQPRATFCADLVSFSILSWIRNRLCEASGKSQEIVSNQNEWKGKLCGNCQIPRPGQCNKRNIASISLQHQVASVS